MFWDGPNDNNIIPGNLLVATGSLTKNSLFGQYVIVFFPRCLRIDAVYNLFQHVLKITRAQWGVATSVTYWVHSLINLKGGTGNKKKIIKIFFF